MPKLINEIGNQYERLTVLRRAGTRRGQALWLCRCTCGKETAIVGVSLRNGDTQSCGCLSIEKTRERTILPIGEAAFNALIHHLKYSARQRGYSWNLTRDQTKTLTSQSCFYCGMKPSQKGTSAKRNGEYLYNGLDRINNAKGYTIENVVPCCAICNWGKMDMTQSKFLTWISRVYAHSILKERDETLS